MRGREYTRVQFAISIEAQSEAREPPQICIPTSRRRRDAVVSGHIDEGDFQRSQHAEVAAGDLVEVQACARVCMQDSIPSE